jgi:hypothetical protein
MVEFDRWIVRARALAQTHPFSPRSYRYVNGVVARERETQPAPEMGLWAGQALMVGYCLRRVEEQDGTDGAPPAAGAAASLPPSLDGAATQVARLLRTEGAEPFLMSPEEHLVEVLDHLIEGEVERRLGDWGEGEKLEAGMAAELEEYLAWWTIKGYALRVVDQLLPGDVAEDPEPEGDGAP